MANDKHATNGKSNGKPEEWTNEAIADRFEQIADLLETQNANPFRVRAYRLAAGTLRELKRPAANILAEEGLDGLEALPNIGESLALAIAQLVHTGKIPLLDQLRGEATPERVLASVPGIGPALAARIHEQLGIGTLPDLEAAAHDGRLAEVPGFGTKRLRAVREVLAGRLHRRPPRPTQRPRPSSTKAQPPVSELLDVDAEYRKKAKEGKLPRITPRRFNPTREAWLPILHTQRGDNQYTVLFSNTARAHELGVTDDWVVIYRDDNGNAGQWTVVTGWYNPLRGKRVVRGREEECVAYYQEQEAAREKQK